MDEQGLRLIAAWRKIVTSTNRPPIINVTRAELHRLVDAYDALLVRAQHRAAVAEADADQLAAAVYGLIVDVPGDRASDGLDEARRAFIAHGQAVTARG